MLRNVSVGSPWCFSKKKGSHIWFSEIEKRPPHNESEWITERMFQHLQVLSSYRPLRLEILSPGKIEDGNSHGNPSVWFPSWESAGPWWEKPSRCDPPVEWSKHAMMVDIGWWWLIVGGSSWFWNIILDRSWSSLLKFLWKYLSQVRKADIRLGCQAPVEFCSVVKSCRLHMTGHRQAFHNMSWSWVAQAFNLVDRPKIDLRQIHSNSSSITAHGLK